jgi:hypothetical protein
MDNSKIRAQVVIEFALVFTLLIVFLVATTRIFVWLASGIIKRHHEYEISRSTILTAPTLNITPVVHPGAHSYTPWHWTPPVSITTVPPIDFYDEKANNLTIFEGNKNILQ